MKKISIVFAIATMLFAFVGCSSTANNLGDAMDGYNMDGYTYDFTYDNGNMNNYSGTTDAYTYNGTGYWDGYGINNGRPMANSDVSTSLSQDLSNIGTSFRNTVSDIFDNRTTTLTN